MPFTISVCGHSLRSARRSSQVSESVTIIERPIGSAVIRDFISVG